MKQLLRIRECKRYGTGVSWVRAHIGIIGKEIADKQAALQSHLGRVRSSPLTATEAGIRQTSKATRASFRAQPGYGMGRGTNYRRQALSAYTWMRTNKVPQRSWLLKLGKADGSYCTHCDHHTQDGTHLVFHCPALDTDRRHYIGGRQSDSWEALDLPLLILNEEEENEYIDGTEQFFFSLFSFLT